MSFQHSTNQQTLSSLQNPNFADTSVQFVTSNQTNNQNQPPSYYPQLYQQSQPVLVQETRYQQQQLQPQQQPAIILRNIIPDHYLVWSIINIIFFNIILGSIAVAFSVSTRRRIRRNLLPEAHISSRNAFILNLVTTCFGLFFWVIGTILLVTYNYNDNVNFN